ncbi:hypothetical protein [Haliangium ochraceum]|uniref:Uncharacterized protein n=1 Tax=Haliangium ochraceum (strain DSM 14365 / JCM 11303 / SMP-2) TaxID=502025 RepID=D0LR12_HALO1|nr:hypothetical protein [Haliangium ochraceum]ACY15520.1 hypothetical protein Hoch_3013 [Haliangium ochraceum DSM 14365]
MSEAEDELLAAKQQGMEVFLEAPLDDFPAGSYGFYFGELTYLRELDFSDMSPDEASTELDTLFQVWDGVGDETRQMLQEKLAGNDQVWFTEGDDIWLSEAGMAAMLPLLDEDDLDEIACYAFACQSDEALFDAVHALIFERFESLGEDWDEIDADDYDPDDEFGEKLDKVEDERVRAVFLTLCDGDPASFELCATPQELAAHKRGVHLVCELEDAHQQDFVSHVLFIPKTPFGGSSS